MTDILSTRLSDLLGVRYPIIQGPMGWVAGPELVAAVSSAGGLGVLANQLAQAKDTVPNPGYELPTAEEWERSPIEWQRRTIRQVKSLTDQPFAVFSSEDPGWMEMAIEEGVKIVVNSGGPPGHMTTFYKQHGLTVLHMGSTVRHAQICQEVGVDAFILAGYEAGGHDPGGWDHITTFAGIPQVVAAVDIPVIACGGIATGRSLVAAFVLGAEGVRMGTRFAATVEASNHPNHKRAIVKALDTGTVSRGERLGDRLRSIKTPFVNRLKELEMSGAPTEELEDLFGGDPSSAGPLQRRILGEVDGDLQNGEVHAGQIAGLISEILPAGEVVRRIMTEAEEVIASFMQRG